MVKLNDMRTAFRLILLMLGLGLVVACYAFLQTASAAEPEQSVSANSALSMLQQGNERFVDGTMLHPNAGCERREETSTGGQHPFVTVLACSDSRVPVEMVFDQGIGDVFVVRVAGNVADTDEIGSIEYGAGHLKTPLVVVMGHTQCGAVTAVCTNAEVGGSIPLLVDNIVPAVTSARAAHPDASDTALVPFAIEENVWHSIEQLLENSSEVRELVHAGSCMVVGAVYDINSGTIHWLGPHPKQADFIEHQPQATEN